MKILSAVAAFALLSLATGCDGPPSPSSLKDEPVCPDFAFGPTKTMMHGGLRQPLLMRVKDGRTVVGTATVYGLPTAGTKPTLFLLPDANATYNVEWLQCPNERAPIELSDTKGKKPKEGVTGYACGLSDDVKPFTTVKLTTKKGDAGSRTISVPEAPNPACWSSDLPAAPEGSAAPAAGSAAPAAGSTAPAAGSTAPAAGSTAPATGSTEPAASAAP